MVNVNWTVHRFRSTAPIPFGLRLRRSGAIGLLVVGVAIAALTPPAWSGQATAWEDLWGSLQKQKSRGISRGDVCAIAPAAPTNEPVWSVHPLFVWRGNIARIEVHPLGSEQVLWQQSLLSVPPLPDHTRVRYTGVPLQPGKSYEWRLYKAPTGEASINAVIPFQILNATDRTRISTQLTTLDATLRGRQATAEVRVQQRAAFFAHHQLWADVLEELYSVEQPSLGLQHLIQQVEAKTCQS